ncbi:unnamed protein product [Linum trigynum]|uniref:Uncharacterized protein n=1 Tax=Linum trigynum TaxID=586398 RepID=A0AAV2ERM0_9ROSI
MGGEVAAMSPAPRISSSAAGGSWESSCTCAYMGEEDSSRSCTGEEAPLSCGPGGRLAISGNSSPTAKSSSCVTLCTTRGSSGSSPSRLVVGDDDDEVEGAASLVMWNENSLSTN